MTAPHFRIGSRTVGASAPCFVVAEVSANHNHSLDRAVAIIRAAARAGADAVKLQTYTPDTLTLDCDAEYFRVGSGSLWAGRTLYDLYAEAFTPWEWHAELFRVAREAGVVCFSTPFDPTAVAVLEELGAPAHKIASFEIVDIGLLQAVGRTGKPIIMSTGMASESEIHEGLAALRGAGAGAVALLKCTSAYPAPSDEMNLRTIPDMAARFGVVVGLSDHTMGSRTACTAVALGAAVVEKHFTLRRSDGGPDAAFSMEPDEFAAMVSDIRETERTLGGVVYGGSSSEAGSRTFRRSLFVVADVRAGEAFTPQNVRSIRPGHGLHPRELSRVLGRRAAADIPRGTPLAPPLIENWDAGVPSLRPRLATTEDAEPIWMWRNDPVTRAASFQTGEVPWDTHRAWFAARLADPDTRLYMLEAEGEGPVAQVRFERAGGGAAEVHITVAPAARGRGIGTAALLATVPLALEALGVDRIHALVKRGNAASRRAFERSGFALSLAPAPPETDRFEYVHA